MPWVQHEYGFLEYKKENDTTEVTMSLRDLTLALEALKRARRVEPSFEVGDKITISATVTGMKQRHVSVVLDNVPGDIFRSFTFPAAALALASKKS